MPPLTASLPYQVWHFRDAALLFDGFQDPNMHEAFTKRWEHLVAPAWMQVRGRL